MVSLEIRCDQNDHFWDRRPSVHWINKLVAILPVAFGRADGELGQVEEAKRCAEEATAVMNVTNERWYEAEIATNCRRNRASLPDSDLAKAEANFKHALSIARQQQSKSWGAPRGDEHGAALARSGETEDAARDLLAPVYGWFTEGFDTLDLKEAKALLDELAS